MADLPVFYNAFWFLLVIVLLWINSKVMKFPKTDILTAVKTGILYALYMFVLSFMAALLLYPLTTVVSVTLLAILLGILFIPVHVIMLAAVVQLFYKVGWVKAGLTGAIITAAGLVIGVIIVIIAMAFGLLG